MDKGYEKEQFTTISFKVSVADKFRVFSKKMGASNSMTLLMMLDFFETNNLSPKESIGPTVHTLENLIKKRVSAVIAILRDMEKSQTRPTVAMMQSLFQEAEPKNKPLLVEKNRVEEKKVRFQEKRDNDNQT
ncbi:hypothetical protein MACH07_22370 [Flagellimonas marinaquae]|uniref:Uncharacterized protein n=1 Tax=Flagellimonas marinaquae TaxID=254955 RepID=A0AA48HKK5_9FLAO|nr:hypothetical protein MACH07_22370 [Allomuricauda aquimarina]